ncbi:Acyl-coenzyme A:6-aminopenicillanic-acid-acyltransferase 40 kDa form [Ooceraea biroi]|uniref:Acyl-coenzyme A:6-aminopenicillanic-acid-acyltransferase 40 kDa form n=1 Tax=Ooceraea biroi TaxID=2015173 RepID=A0A026VVP6_OOCBI|nr:Acyl-coenzyme A:6-aminopenicillanic-acid-acyltransferase 40 kDa form [Ooceraea biroi]
MATLESYTNGSAGTNGGIGRRNAVPIIHVRGTHYEIGFDIGRTFAKMIQDFVSIYAPLNETYLPLFATEKGRMVYEETLDVVKKQFPQYVREIQGTADGANVPFHKLFLMHLDDIISNATNGTQANVLPVGCSTIICNQPGHEIIGHNEDALSETLNHWYLVRAHVVEVGCKEEKFTSLSYAGFLPGYTMGYNHHGLVYSINTLSAAVLRSGKIPRYFLTRALLGVENFVQAQETLRNEGCGAAEGFSVNMTFLAQEGDRMFHNAEVGPAEADSARSQLNVLTVSPGENTSHCNKYLRLKVAEVEGLIIQSSIKRMKAISKHPPAKCRQDVIDILSDQTDDEFRVYQEIGCDDYVKTLATGIFDCKERTWSIYTDKPQCNEPILVIPMQLRDPQSGKANK